MELAKRLEDVLTTLYDYEYIDIESFYNDKNMKEALEILEKVSICGDFTSYEEEAIKDLYTELDYFIKFETDYNSDIGDF